MKTQMDTPRRTHSHVQTGKRRDNHRHTKDSKRNQDHRTFLSSQLHPQPPQQCQVHEFTLVKQTNERMNEHGRVGRRRGAYIVYADNPNTLCCPQILLVLQSPLCHAPHQETLRSLCPASRHRGRSPEGGRKSRRRHSRRYSKTLCKASPEARSSPQPSQPLQMLSFLSARGVVSIPHSLLCQSWPGHLGEVEAQVQGSV